MRATERPPRRRALLAACSVAVATAVPTVPAPAAPPPRVEPFDAAAWTRLQATLPRPAVVVFTRTTCATCPEVFDGLRRSLRERGLAAPLVAVVLDGEALGRSRHDAHLGQADRLYAFRGQEAVLRHAVDPAWRGVTPYVALLAADGTTRFGAGTPAPERLDAWAVARRASPD
jgi:hypothetical protein